MPRPERQLHMRETSNWHDCPRCFREICVRPQLAKVATATTEYAAATTAATNHRAHHPAPFSCARSALIPVHTPPRPSQPPLMRPGDCACTNQGLDVPATIALISLRPIVSHFEPIACSNMVVQHQGVCVHVCSSVVVQHFWRFHDYPGYRLYIDYLMVVSVSPRDTHVVTHFCLYSAGRKIKVSGEERR